MTDSQHSVDKDPSLRPLEPLESALITYLGRDENGLIFSRLGYMQPRDQMTYIPRIIHCLVNRTPDLNRLYAGNMAYRFSLLESEATNQPPAQIMTDDGRQALADRFRIYAESLFSIELMEEKTGLLKPMLLTKYAQLALSDYSEDTFVKSARDAYKLLKENELDHLAVATMCTAVALVHQLSVYNDQATTPNGPTAA